MDQLKHLIEVWTGYAQGLTGSIGALAFVCAFIWKMIAIEPRSVMEAKRWIGRIVFGTIGVEMAGMLVRVLGDSVNHCADLKPARDLLRPDHRLLQQPDQRRPRLD